jgi:carbonic anhydrase
MRTQIKETQAEMTPKHALEILRDGNARFLANLKANRNLLEQVNTTSSGQYPFAVILSCIDSRTSAELIFDQGLGDIFSIRIAGNVLNEDILGSMEFACMLAGSKLIVVVGHSACGAVKGACAGAELGHLTGLLRKIQPAVEQAGGAGETVSDEFIDEVALHNVEHVIAEIRDRSSVLEGLITAGKVGVVGAMYSVQTGQTDFMDLVCGTSD